MSLASIKNFLGQHRIFTAGMLAVGIFFMFFLGDLSPSRAEIVQPGISSGSQVGTAVTPHASGGGPVGFQYFEFYYSDKYTVGER